MGAGRVAKDVRLHRPSFANVVMFSISVLVSLSSPILVPLSIPTLVFPWALTVIVTNYDLYWNRHRNDNEIYTIITGRGATETGPSVTKTEGGFINHEVCVICICIRAQRCVRFYRWAKPLIRISQQLMRLEQEVEKKRPEFIKREGVVLATQQILKEFDWELLMHPPYSPDLTP
ncbi:hypothetical protein EVAR_42697_1 [Eumeta japonica]|uniref:Mariner Mos1 transposase n=1 Tax=Eumeta variegata TaxID=151549 RepID=A0A4C1X2D9_EUMVA|nr:hypothetical protein EVAR_42697_1 [Eumeta japonica]